MKKSSASKKSAVEIVFVENEAVALTRFMATENSVATDGRGFTFDECRSLRFPKDVKIAFVFGAVEKF